MNRTDNMLTDILIDNPHAIAAWIDRDAKTDTIVVLTRDPAPIHRRNPAIYDLAAYNLIQRDATELRPLITTQDLDPRNAWQACQNEPITLGCQIQPAHANWVGTAGAPVRWRDLDGLDHWGILSNWHVMYGPNAQIGHTQHQPLASWPACAKLSHWVAPQRLGTHYLDAAIADAQIDGYHTIGREILGLGKAAETARNAEVGDQAVKSGRTTAVTGGTCIAVGAAARVNYGSFNAVFADQDVYQRDGGNFSAPGDSGSAILHDHTLALMSLLFAGGGNITIGCPVRRLITAFNLQFPP
ncbi:MAG: hypothetical protein PHS77_11400, partial [Gallionellaceae bacterium]|nr:hypothetical protein [Gallionellaceae bacterium]